MDLENLLVSVAPQKIYDLPGSLHEFHAVAQDWLRANEAGISYIFNIFNSQYYRHTANKEMFVNYGEHLTENMLNSYNSELHCHATASALVIIEDAIIQQSVVYWRNNGKHGVVYETYRQPDRASIPLSDEAIRGDIAPAEFQVEGRAYLFLGSAGSFNYGHWLVDDLPRAKAWLDLRERLGISCVLVLPAHGPKMDEVRAQSLRILLDPDVEIEFIPPDRPCRIANLYYASPVSYHPRIKNPLALDFVRSRLVTRVGAMDDVAGRRIFVARKPPNSRSVGNFDELWQFLDVRGFEMVEPESLDFESQVRTFLNADIVIGQMGAGMTGSIFCKPATNLIYLVPEGWNEPFFLDLAAVGGQQYNVLVGPKLGDGVPWLADFVVPLDHLYHRLKYMGVDAP